MTWFDAIDSAVPGWKRDLVQLVAIVFFTSRAVRKRFDWVELELRAVGRRLLRLEVAHGIKPKSALAALDGAEATNPGIKLDPKKETTS